MKPIFKDPQAMLSRFMQSWWASILLPVGLLALLIGVLLKLGGDMPSLAGVNRKPVAPASEVVPLSRAETLFSAQAMARVVPVTNLDNPLYTLYFKPPPEPPKPVQPPPPPTNPPPPPPPPTKKVPVVYQGFIEASDGGRKAFIKVGDVTLAGTNGIPVVADRVLAAFDLRTATLLGTNATNVLIFNQVKELELPAK
jgi:hypothetical protein